LFINIIVILILIHSSLISDFVMKIVMLLCVIIDIPAPFSVLSRWKAIFSTNNHIFILLPIFLISWIIQSLLMILSILSLLIFHLLLLLLHCNPSLTVLTHWNVLLIWVARTITWWNIF